MNDEDEMSEEDEMNDEDEMSEEELLKGLVRILISQLNDVECGLCGEKIFCCDQWWGGHTPIVRVSSDKVELGYYCGKEDKEVILFTIGSTIEDSEK